MDAMVSITTSTKGMRTNEMGKNTSPIRMLINIARCESFQAEKFIILYLRELYIGYAILMMMSQLKLVDFVVI